MGSNENSKETKEEKRFAQKFYASYRVNQTLKKVVADKRLTSKQKYLMDVGQRLAQTESVFERVKNANILFSSFNPLYEKRGVSRVRQLIYHIENYLNNIYVLQNRVKKLSGYIRKKGRKKEVNENKLNRLKNQENKFVSALQNIEYIRGEHVHQKNYVDEGIRHLELLQTFYESGKSLEIVEDEKLKIERDFHYKKMKDKWKKTSKENAKGLKELLEDLYSFAEPVINETYHTITTDKN